MNDIHTKFEFNRFPILYFRRDIWNCAFSLKQPRAFSTSHRICIKKKFYIYYNVSRKHTHRVQNAPSSFVNYIISFFTSRNKNCVVVARARNTKRARLKHFYRFFFLTRKQRYYFVTRIPSRNQLTLCISRCPYEWKKRVRVTTLLVETKIAIGTRVVRKK